MVITDDMQSIMLIAKKYFRKIENHVKKDVLESIIDLYVRIHSLTYAKDIVQKI